ncbi:DUF1572 family protein [Neobacillus rhizosphaerae]|uniref:DUF1572 family protein n=1 Tax=Neobacillus rhizosphaerae TaxID=2880965 RepID=UPI0029E80894|nr:DUF1572 family protein [Neobacillus rhizosphaerae]
MFLELLQLSVRKNYFGEIRQLPISVLQAIQTELAHISYHLGQILFLGKQIKDKDWNILSIPKNGSKEFNQMSSNKK